MKKYGLQKKKKFLLQYKLKKHRKPNRKYSYKNILKRVLLGEKKSIKTILKKKLVLKRNISLLSSVVNFFFFKKFKKLRIPRRVLRRRKRKISYRFFSPDLVYLNVNKVYRFQLYAKYKLEFFRKFRLYYHFNKYSKVKSFFKKKDKKSNYHWHFATNRLFFALLERRLDILIYRAGFVRSLFELRQYLAHRLVYVNGKVIQSPLYTLKQGDVISFSFKLRRVLRFSFLQKRHKKLKKRHLSSFQHFESSLRVYKIILLTQLVNPRQAPLLLKKSLDIHFFKLG